MAKKFIGVTLILLGLGLIFWFSSRERGYSEIRIGVPESAAGVIFQYTVNKKMPQDGKTIKEMEVYPIKDCCSTTSEWALSSGSLELAVLCPDAAQRLIEKDARYEVVGPCMVNSDVVVVRGGKEGGAKKIAVCPGRDFQRKLIKRLFGEGGTAVQVFSSAIPYAYEKKWVDGAVIDILNGFLLRGEMVPSFGKDGDLVTYVLVARKAFKETSLYRKFMKSYENALNELKHEEVLQEALRQYRQFELTPERVRLWKKLNVKFTDPVSQGLPE